MKVLFTAILLIAFTLPAMSQDNNASVKENFRNQAKTLLNLMKSGKYKENIRRQKPGYLTKGYQYIPIPPATKWNSKSELLPLYKEGTRITVPIKK